MATFIFPINLIHTFCWNEKAFILETLKVQTENDNFSLENLILNLFLESLSFDPSVFLHC
jgi:hypothetical protein